MCTRSTVGGNISAEFNIQTRPTAITGGNYGIVGDNGQIIKVEDNSSIVNETNNTYWNPATGNTSTITDWTFDYSDRSYNLTLDGGTTSTVTYGDENITIQEGDTSYTIYYVTNTTTPTDPDTPPAPHVHDFQPSGSVPATCTQPGQTTYSCTCGETKTEPIPALDHDWQVKQQINTEYDDTGQLIQAGYTVYECSRCHEQYKAEDGTGPPSVIPGTETFLEKVGSALANVRAMLAYFKDELIGSFSGFTDFLCAVFPFVPDEFWVIGELGLFLLFAVLIIRKAMS